MFNSPFGSFHDTVAEAKEEREQLDRLLTISTPRERLLVIGIALLLCILTAWLFFGSVGRNVTVDGVLVEPVANALDGSKSVRTLVWIESNVAAQVKAGMPAVIELDLADGEKGTRDGVIAAISAAPLPVELVAFASSAPVSVYRVDITLDDGLELASVAGQDCRMIIELGNESPVGHFK